MTPETVQALCEQLRRFGRTSDFTPSWRKHEAAAMNQAADHLSSLLGEVERLRQERNRPEWYDCCGCGVSKAVEGGAPMCPTCVREAQAKRRACNCAEPDPVQQADRKFYCHTCSFETGARPNGLEPEAVYRERDTLRRERDDLLAKVKALPLTLDEQDDIWCAINASVRPLPEMKPGFTCDHCDATFPFEHPRTDCHVSTARDAFAALLNRIAALAHAPRPGGTA